jgi:hypothetical protein
VDRLWLERFARKERAYCHCQPDTVGSMLKALTSKKSDSNRVRFKREQEANSCVRGTDKAAKTWAKRLRMNKDNEYRENAAERERMTRVTRDKTDKRTWLDMAQHWRGLISVPPGGGQQPGD